MYDFNLILIESLISIDCFVLMLDSWFLQTVEWWKWGI